MKLDQIVHVLKQIFPPNTKKYKAMKFLAGGQGKDPRYDQAIKVFSSLVPVEIETEVYFYTYTREIRE